MAKNKKNDIQCLRDAQNQLLNAFVEYKFENRAKKSFDQYRQIVNALAVLENDPNSNNMVRNFWDLIPKLISAGKKEETRLIILLDELKKANDIFVWGESKKSYKTYINSFISYCRHCITLEKKGNPLNSFKLPINPADEAALGDEQGLIYLRSALLTKFKSRLRCQDRTSGDKIWLPLRFIAKLYSIEKKDKAIKNRFSEWLNNLAEGIFVHYVEDQSITCINFGEENVSLKFDVHNNNGCDTDLFDVKVRIVNDDGTIKDYTAYTPTGKGNIKVPLIVKNISEIDIDHVKSIDKTLREKENNFKALKKVSDFYKELQEQDDCDENKAAKQLYDMFKNNELDGLLEDLELIRNDGVLRLMDSQYNSQKSNGETFQDVIQNGEEYWGILEQEHDILNDNGEKCIYYQVLTNSTSQNEFRVTRKDFPIEGESYKNNLKDIINYI